jgi:hypothetical protein
MHLYAPTRIGEVRLYRRPARKLFCAVCTIGVLSILAGRPVTAQAPVPDDIQAALEHTTELMRTPVHVDVQYEYLMTARVRLLLFWVGKDDVGGGYIRRGRLAQDPDSEVIELLIGSDPAKAPRAINRWGAASEIARKPSGSGHGAESSTFFGFMKVSSGTSAADMEKELAREKRGGAFLFSAIINRGEGNFDFAKVVPFSSETDFTIHQFDQAKSMVFDRLLGSEGRLKKIDAKEVLACGRREGFLESVAELVDSAIETGREKPPALCYFYNGVHHQLTLAQVTKVPSESVKLALRDEPHDYVRTYRDLVLGRFENFDQTNKKKTEFELLLGTTGNLRGVPVQIRYQPNWWFQAILNLKTPENAASAQNQ